MSAVGGKVTFWWLGDVAIDAKFLDAGDVAMATALFTWLISLKVLLADLL